MDRNQYNASAEILIDAPADEVWDALVNPVKIKQYMFGTDVSSDWKVGSEITWKGEWQGKPYSDRGKILQFDPGKTLQYSHITGGDRDENYHVVTVTLDEKDGKTGVHLTQDNNSGEEMKKESEKNWNSMLSEMKKLIEG